MDLAAQNSGKCRHSTRLFDGAAHASGKIGNAGIDHAAEGRRALDDDNGLAAFEGFLHFLREDNVTFFGHLHLNFAVLIRIICCCGFLVDGGEHIHEFHPGLDIVADIRRSHKLAFVADQVAGSRARNAVLVGGVSVLIPRPVFHVLCLNADPAICKYIQTGDPLTGA